MLVASSLLFSVATVRLWSGRRLGWTAWAAVLAVIVGIASFVALAPPAGGVPGVSGHAGLAAACLATCAVPLAAAGLAAAGRRRAVLLAVAAGLADAGIAVVTMAFSHVVSGGLTGMAGSWATYALMLGGPCSLLLTQTAYQAGRPMITLPVIAVVTPVASLAAGNLLLGESARLGVLSGAVAALAVLVTSAGLVVLARLTTGQPGPVGGQGSSVTSPAFPASGSRSGPDPVRPVVRPAARIAAAASAGSTVSPRRGTSSARGLSGHSPETELLPLLSRRCRGSCCRPRQDVLLDRPGEALVLVGGCHVGSLTPYFLAGVAHRNAQPAPLEHQHVVRPVAERRDLLQRDL